MPAKQVNARTARLAVIGGVSAFALIAGVLATVPSSPSGAQVQQTEAVTPLARGDRAFEDGYADLIEQILPAVVSVQVTSENPARVARGPRPGQQGQPEVPEQFREFFERFFGDQMPDFFEGPQQGPQPFGQRPQPFGGPQRRGLGSGFIIDPSGIVVTNNHVVDGAGTVEIGLEDGRELQAEVIGTDSRTDLAVLRVQSDDGDLPFVTWADSGGARVGDRVIAVGNPFGFGGTVTSGIISALGRDIGSGPYDDYMQIDASINRGNSGGPTFNLNGEVVGVNTAIFSPSGGNVGIGFAIPANLAQTVIDDLLDDGAIERGWLGVAIQTVNEEIAQALGLTSEDGALVSQVTNGGPAEESGIRQGDVIVGFNGEAVDRMRSLPRLVAEVDPGTRVDVEVVRNGEMRTVEVTLGTLPGQEEQVAALSEPESPEQPRLGLSMAPLNPETRAQFDIANELEGVLVTEVQPDSPAAEKAIRPGDVILEVNQQRVAEASEVASRVRQAAEEGKNFVLLLINRDGSELFIPVRLETAQG